MKISWKWYVSINKVDSSDEKCRTYWFCLEIHLCVIGNCVIHSMQIPKDDLNIFFVVLCLLLILLSKNRKKLFAVENISWHERSKKAFAKTNNVSLNYYILQRTTIEGEKNSITKILNTFVTFLNQCICFLLSVFILLSCSHRISEYELSYRSNKIRNKSANGYSRLILLI